MYRTLLAVLLVTGGASAFKFYGSGPARQNIGEVRVLGSNVNLGQPEIQGGSLQQNIQFIGSTSSDSTLTDASLIGSSGSLDLGTAQGAINLGHAFATSNQGIQSGGLPSHPQGGFLPGTQFTSISSSGVQDQSGNQLGFGGDFNQGNIVNIQLDPSSQAQGSITTSQQPIFANLQDSSQQGPGFQQTGIVSDTILNVLGSQSAGDVNLDFQDIPVPEASLQNNIVGLSNLQFLDGIRVVVSTKRLVITETVSVTETSDFVSTVHFGQTTTVTQRLPSRDYTSGTPETQTRLVTRSILEVEPTTLTTTRVRYSTVTEILPSIFVDKTTRTFVYTVTHVNTSNVTKRKVTYVTQTLQQTPSHTVTSTYSQVTTFYTSKISPTPYKN